MTQTIFKISFKDSLLLFKNANMGNCNNKESKPPRSVLRTFQKDDMEIYIATEDITLNGEEPSIYKNCYVVKVGDRYNWGISKASDITVKILSFNRKTSEWELSNHFITTDTTHLKLLKKV